MILSCFNSWIENKIEKNGREGKYDNEKESQSHLI